MMRHEALSIAFALSLAACGSDREVDLENASVEEVAQAVGDSGAPEDVIRPGKWQTKVTVEEVDIPGMPAEAQTQMKGIFAQRQNVTVDHCVTPDEAKKPDGRLFTGQDSGNCRYEHFTMGGGKVDAVMRCQGNGSGSMTMKMTGTYTPDSSTTRSEMVVSGAREGNITMKALTEAHRVGECDGKKD